MKLLDETILMRLNPRGLLRWRDVARITAAIKARGSISCGDGKQVPGGVWINPNAAAAAAAVADQPFSVHPDGAGGATIMPGIVLGGCGWIIPTIGGESIFRSPAPEIEALAYVYLAVTAAPVLAADTYASGNTYRAPAGTSLWSAEIIASDVLLADTEAMALVIHDGFNESIGLLNPGVYHQLIGTRDEEGEYPFSGLPAPIVCHFENATYGTITDQPTFRLAFVG